MHRSHSLLDTHVQQRPGHGHQLFVAVVLESNDALFPGGEGFETRVEDSDDLFEGDGVLGQLPVLGVPFV